MTREDMVALFSRRNQNWARRDAVELAEDYSEDSVAESPMQGRIEGRHQIQEVFANWFESFGDLTFTSRDVLIDGDRVAQFFAIRGTQSEPFGGIPSTGRKIDFKGAALFTFGPDGMKLAVNNAFGHQLQAPLFVWIGHAFSLEGLRERVLGRSSH